jgi:hypothetical protein
MSDWPELYCSYCGGNAVLIRSVGKKGKKEYLCNECIGKEERGEPKKQQYQLVDNI